MKKSHIFLIVVIAVAVGVVFSLVKDARTYGTFANAAEQPEKNYEVVGVLDTTAAIEYDAMVNPDQFSFFMFDEEQNRHKVIVSQPKPQDFEKSTQVVVGGVMKEDAFYANHILLKCPSKYEGQGPAQLQVQQGEMN
jgi:cytochrome c-type biogenesis protein CcmE